MNGIELPSELSAATVFFCSLRLRHASDAKSVRHGASRQQTDIIGFWSLRYILFAKKTPGFFTVFFYYDPF